MNIKCTCYQSTSAGDNRIDCRKEGCAAVHNMTFAPPRLGLMTSIKSIRPIRVFAATEEMDLPQGKSL